MTQRYDLTDGRTLDASDLREVGTVLREGGLVVYPTDTLYALGCRALSAKTVTELRRAKGRESDKPLPVIVCDVEQARSLAAFWPWTAQRLADAFWPGPLTLVVRAAPGLPESLLAGATSIAMRVPDSTVARALAGEVGPLVSTSANASGEPPCVTVDLALQAFPVVSVILDTGPLDGSPSTIVDVTDESRAVVLREGRIARSRVDAALLDSPKA